MPRSITEITAFGWAVAAVVTFIVLLLGWSVTDEWRFSSQRIGVYISQQEQHIRIDAVDPDSPADRAGLQADDRLVSFEGTPVANLAELNTLFDRHFRPGLALEAIVEHDGEERAIELTPGVPLDLTSLLAKFVLVSAYLGLAVLAARYRHTDLRARILTAFVALVALELALPAGHTLGTVALTATLLFWLLSTGLQFALELHLVGLIPSRLPQMRRRPWLVPACYLIGVGSGLLLCALALHQWFLATPEAPGWLGPVQTAVLLVWAVSVASILAWQAWRAETARETNQALLVLAGLLPWAIHIVITTVWSGWQALDPRLAELIESLVLLAFPATVFLAIFRYGLFDAESLVRRGLVYGTVALLIVILLYTLLTTALPLIEANLGERTGQWFVTACAVLIGILFRPLRHGIERLVERGLFPRRRALRHRLIQVGASLSVHSQLQALVQQLAEDTREALGVDWAAVVAVDSGDDGQHATAYSRGTNDAARARLIELLDTRSSAFESLDRLRRPITVNRLQRRHADAAGALAQIGAEVLVPLYFQRRMIGILCLGRKLSGQLFRREEIELLDLFSHQIAASLENLRLFQDATYEELTGLLRREAVLRQLEAESARAVRHQTALSVCMIDLDHFKAVNDSHGHLFGDRILEGVASAMKDRVRSVDALGRYGGEEFLLVLPDTDVDGARKLAEELRQAVSDLRFEVPDGSGTIGVTMSIGIASAKPRYQDAGRLAADLLGQADAAVYQAKTGGRNRMVIRAELAEQEATDSVRPNP